MKVDYHRNVDAAYFSFSIAECARQEKLDDARIIDYDTPGEVVWRGIHHSVARDGSDRSP